MREILFRGKDEKTGGWLHGSLVHLFGEPHIIGYGLLIKVVPQTVGQYTGINDKNGVKIFEGDIIRAITEGEEDTYTVRWCGDDRYPAFDLKPQPDCDSNGLSYLLWTEAEIEVIGNIHDNPKLLGGNGNEHQADSVQHRNGADNPKQ